MSFFFAKTKVDFLGRTAGVDAMESKVKSYQGGSKPSILY